MPRYSRGEAFRRFLARLLKNLVMLALIVALIWGLMQAAKLNMPALQPNKTRILDY